MNVNRNAGFTLMEMLAVLAIFTVMAALSYPYLSDYIRNSRYRDVASDIGMVLRQARSHAIAKNQECEVQFEFAANRYRIVQDPSGAAVDLTGWKDVPVGIVLRQTKGCNNNTDVDLEFNPDGTGLNRWICVMADNNGSLTEKMWVGVVSQITGRVAISKEKPS